MMLRARVAIALAAMSLLVLTVTDADADPDHRPAAGPHASAVTLSRYVQTSQDVHVAGAFQRIYDPSTGESVPWNVNDHSIVRGPDGTWHLYGISFPEPPTQHKIKFLSHATSKSLHGPFVKQKPVLTTDPDYGEVHLWAPHIVSSGGTYYMFYAAGSPDTPKKAAINLATSTDLWHWKRLPSGSLFTDGFEARDPMVLRVGDRWVMYYCANETRSGGHHVVAYRTSTDLVHWSDRHIAYRSAGTGTGAGNTESPFVVHHDGSYYLFVGPCGAYLGGVNDYHCTDVFRSDDPLHFSRANHVGRLRVHAPEVIQSGGKAYITDSGDGEGGVYLAPLSFDGHQQRSGIQVTAPGYTAKVQTSPFAELSSLALPHGANVLDDEFRGTRPYLGVGGTGDTARTGKPAKALIDRRNGVVRLQGIPMGREPVTADWTLRFHRNDLDSTVDWHVSGALTAPLKEGGWSLDTDLPQLGDDTSPVRKGGQLMGFPSYVIASDDKNVTLAAAYKRGSTFQEYGRWSDTGVGDFSLQFLITTYNYEWHRGSYAGGTWRLGLSPQPTDTAYAAQLTKSLNS